MPGPFRKPWLPRNGSGQPLGSHPTAKTHGRPVSAAWRYLNTAARRTETLLRGIVGAVQPDFPAVLHAPAPAASSRHQPPPRARIARGLPRRLLRGDRTGAWLLDRTSGRPRARWARDCPQPARDCRRWWTQARGRPRWASGARLTPPRTRFPMDQQQLRELLKAGIDANATAPAAVAGDPRYPSGPVRFTAT